MPVKLVVSSTTNPAESHELVFEQENIAIGRHGSNQVVLPDQQRIVSNHHAEIGVSAGTFEIIDLGSKNFTFVNEERIQSGTPQILQKGDVIRIGDYQILFEPIAEKKIEPEPASYDYERTVFDFNFINPFEDDAALLAAALRSIRKSYEREAPSRRDDALIEAVTQALGTDIDHEAVAVIARCFGHESTADSVETQGPISQRAEQVRPVQPESPRTEIGSARAHISPEAPRSARPREADGSRLERVQDAMFRSFAKVVGMPWQFRHEFIGQTIVQAPGTSFLYENDAEGLRAYLMDPSITDDEFERRLVSMVEAAEDLAIHQVAMLDGYKASVQKGTQRLMEEIDPEKTSREVARMSKLYEIFPVLGASAALKFLLQKSKELQQEDWSVAERRVFRPAFIKAYLARMTSQRRHDLEAF